MCSGALKDRNAMPIESAISKKSCTPPVIVLSLRGVLDTESAFDLEPTIETLIQAHKRLVVDLTWVPYVSSAGWRLFIVRGSRGQQPGIKVAGMRSAVREVYDLMGLEQVISEHDTTESAVETFRSAPNAILDLDQPT
jgi:anti-anti-sigma factor